MISKNTIVLAAMLGLGGFCGGWITYNMMGAKIQKITATHTEQLRVREVQRATDERAARERESALATRAGQIEQEKENAINAVRTDADALIARLRQQAASKPTGSGRVPSTTAACETPAGATVPDRAGEDLVRLAARADELRTALGACYQAYDSISSTRSNSDSSSWNQ